MIDYNFEITIEELKKYIEALEKKGIKKLELRAYRSDLIVVEIPNYRDD